MLLQ
ncbi:short chain dehydrogenase family protein, partial [Vibrio harveyi]|jgi:hypothetical protein